MKCGDCAFIPGTEASNAPNTLVVAHLCALTGEVFTCHLTQRPCGGWKEAVLLRKHSPLKPSAVQITIAEHSKELMEHMVRLAVDADTAAAAPKAGSAPMSDARQWPDHQFVTHPTYTGPGCSICARSEAEHLIPMLEAERDAALQREGHLRIILHGIYEEATRTTLHGPIDVDAAGSGIRQALRLEKELLEALSVSIAALRSYEYGNSSPDLAKECIGYAQAAIASSEAARKEVAR